MTNPENALKTLISRVRTLLSQISPELGNCIVADRGAYHWECLPEMTVDLYELEDIFARLPNERDGERKREDYRRMMTLYRGALLQKERAERVGVSPRGDAAQTSISPAYTTISTCSSRAGGTRTSRRSSASAEARWRESRLTTASTSS